MSEKLYMVTINNLKHLAVCKNARWVVVRTDGYSAHYDLHSEKIDTLLSLLDSSLTEIYAVFEVTNKYLSELPGDELLELSFLAQIARSALNSQV